MKKFVYVSILMCLLGIFCVSCMDNFLGENPQDRLTKKNFYHSEDDAIAAVGAVYNQLYSIYRRNMFLAGDKSTDIEKSGLGQPNQELQNITYKNYTSENSFIGGVWEDNYSGIHRANVVLEKIPNMVKKDIISKDLGNRLMGEVRFLRALFYFNLVRFFGNVPLITKSDQNYKMPRTDKSKVYKQIINDLEFAIQNLSIKYDEANSGRATKGAAKILLGKVYLSLKNYDAAAKELGQVVEHEDKYGYGLFADYKNNWKQSTETGKENVFSVQFTGPPGHWNNAMEMQSAKYNIYKGQGIPCVTPTYEADIPTLVLPHLFSDEDSRKDVTFKTDYTCGDQHYQSKIPMFGKYWQEGISSAHHCAIDYHVMRYSGALLMYGEALFEQGKEAKALEQINRVRERAFKDKNHNYSSLNEKKIWKGYLLEFADEGKRFFRLTRQGRYVKIVKEHMKKEAQLTNNNRFNQAAERVKDYMTLMPIPQHEIDNNPKLKQNPGW